MAIAEAVATKAVVGDAVCLFRETGDPRSCLDCKLPICVEDTTCPVCGKIVTPRSYPEWRQTYCSASCYRRANGIGGVTTSKNATPRRCLQCREWFLVLPRTGRGGSTKQRYCSKACREKYHNKREHRRWRASYQQPAPRLPMSCAYCGTTFTPAKQSPIGYHRHCSVRCYNRDYRLKHGLTKYPHFEAGERECPQCGQLFMSHIPKRGGRPTIYCSRECRLMWQNREGRQGRKRQAKLGGRPPAPVKILAGASMPFLEALRGTPDDSGAY